MCIAAVWEVGVLQLQRDGGFAPKKSGSYNTEPGISLSALSTMTAFESPIKEASGLRTEYLFARYKAHETNFAADELL